MLRNRLGTKLGEVLEVGNRLGLSSLGCELGGPEGVKFSLDIMLGIIIELGGSDSASRLELGPSDRPGLKLLGNSDNITFGVTLADSQLHLDLSWVGQTAPGWRCSAVAKLSRSVRHSD